MAILFVNDIKEHVEVAASLGIQAIHFLSAQQLRRELEKGKCGLEFKNHWQK